mgnify:CR=1 FL=1
MLIINLAGLALIAVVVWWFWLYKPGELVLEEGELTIVVENGIYQPSHIKLSANKPTELQFLRKDATPCSETVLFPALEISDDLPLNKLKRITLPPLEKGEYEFHCQMKMYSGTLKVE